jgi:hypothetical protein
MILTTLLAATTLFGGPTPVQTAPRTSEDTAEGAEILRRILVDALDDTFGRKEKEDGGSTTKIRTLERFGVVTTLWAGRETVQHSRVFHMPDVGLFFSIDAALPVVSKEDDKGAADKDKGAKIKDDEWERARRAVRNGGDGNVFTFRNSPTKEWDIDPRAIDQVVDQVLRTVARHAARVEGLTPRETITVALRLSGRGHGFWSGNGWTDGDGDREGERGAHVDDDEEGLAAEGYNYVLAGGTSAREQNLVIRVALSDLTSYSEGNIETLRQRAQINRY